MLGTSRMTTILPVVDADRARHFYSQVLGLADLGQTGDGKYLFSSGGALLALLPKPRPTSAEHTAVSFEVDDVAKIVGLLQQRGVRFEDYDLPGLKTVNNVCVLGSEKAAWFKDTEGNLLCIHEVLPEAITS